MKNYLIIEAYTDANIGSGALVENTIKLLQQAKGVPLDRIRVMAHYPSVFEDKYGVKAVKDIFNFPFNQPRAKQVLWLIHTCCWLSYAWIFPKAAIKTKRWTDYAWADTVISVGAERINDKYIKNEYFSLFTYAVVKKFGKRMILAPSTYGPFLYSFTRGHAAKVFSKLDLIYCRDQQSYDTAISFKNIDNRRVINSSDVAIFQEWNPDYKQPYFTNDKPIVGVSALQWTYVSNKYETPYCSYQSYVREMSVLIDAIISKYDVNVLLFPTNFPVNGCREDDVVVAKEIYAHCSDKSAIKYIDTLPTAYEFKSLLSCCTANITTRMHACILSTGAYVPTMSINYLFKLREYMDGLGMDKYSIDIEDFCAKDAIPIFDNLWNNLTFEKESLKQSIDQKKIQLFQQMEQI